MSSKIVNFPSLVPHSPYLLSANNIEEIVFYTNDGEQCFIEDKGDVATIMAMIIRSKMNVFIDR
jgi:hypothetical protein